MKRSLLLLAMLFILTSMFAVLLNEGFESTTFPPAEWTTAGTPWEQYTTYFHTGLACTKSGYSPSGDWWLITPRLMPSAGANTLTFWYRDYSNTTAWDYPDEYTYVMVSTTTNAIGSFATTLWTGNYTQFTTDWQQATIDLSAYNDQNIFIAFKSVHTGGNYRMVDDVTGVDLAPATLPPNPAVAVTPANNAANVMASTNLTWLSGGGLPAGYRLYFGTDGAGTTPPTNLVNNQDMGNVLTYDPPTDLVFNTTYYWQVVPYNTNGNAVGCPIWTFTTGGAQVNMTNGTQTVADGMTYSFYDSGGPAGSYQNSENYTFTFTAVNPMAALQFDFTSFDVEEGYDFLKIYNGPNTSSPQIGPAEGYTSTDSPGSFTGNNSVTFVFTSDTSVTYTGWAATVAPVVMGSMAGTVTSGGSPVADVVITLSDSDLTATTDATGAYNLPLVPIGTYNVTATKPGYATQTLNGNIVTNGQTTVVNFVLVQLPIVSVTGTVVGSDAPTVGLADATISLTGLVDYTATTNASGQFTIPGVYASNTYAYVIVKDGYSAGTGNITVGTTNYSMGTITLNEISLPPSGVTAAVAGVNVNLTWNAPSAAGDWIQWDDDVNYTSIGVNGPADFDVASRWPVADLVDFVGRSIFAVKFYPNEVNCVYSIRVWTGGDATAPGAMVCDQVVANPVIADFNTVLLTTPVLIPAGQELWFGVRCNTQAGFPAGCNGGPQTEGLGNMIYFDGAWSSLTALSSTLTYDWNLAAYAAFSPPTRIAPLHAIEFNPRHNTGSLVTSGVFHMQNAPAVSQNTRSLQGYKVWRLTEGNEGNEATWTSLTTNTISATAYSDNGWNAVPDGTYKWAVKAVYTNNVLSNPAFSNSLVKLTQIGTISGIVRRANNQPISGATIATGTYTTTSNATGAYSFQVPAGTHTVTCSATGYVTATQNNVVVVTGVTTNLNFTLQVSTSVTDGFETYADFTLDFPPWVNDDVDASITWAFGDTSFPNMEAPMSYIIFNPSAGTPPVTDAIWLPHGGAKYASCIADKLPASGGTGPNNDWLISQPFNPNVGANFNFWAKSILDNYGLERFKVGVSLGGTAPADFTIISGANYIEAPIEWTNYSYDIPEMFLSNGMRVAINCVSSDAWMFMVDDFTMNLGVGIDGSTTPTVTTALLGNYPNPFNPQTTINYSVKAATPVVVEIYNLKGQKVKTLVNEIKASGNHQITWNGTDDQNNKVTSGVYFYKMTTAGFTSTHKMVMMK